MPTLNKIARLVHNFIKTKVVDLPEIPRSKQKEIAKVVAEYVKELLVEAISESVAKSASNIANDKLNK